ELTLASVPARLQRDGDPWAAIDDAQQSLEPLLALHARDRENGLLDAPWPPVYPKQPDEPRPPPGVARAAELRPGRTTRSHTCLRPSIRVRVFTLGGGHRGGRTRCARCHA